MKKKKHTAIALRAQRGAPVRAAGRFLSALPAAALCSLGLGKTAAEAFPAAVGSAWAAAAVLFALTAAVLALGQTRVSPWVLALGVGLLGITAAVFFAPLRDGLCALGNELLPALQAKTGRIYLPWSVENGANAAFAAGYLAALFALLFGGGVSLLAAAVIFAAGAAAGVVPAGWGAAAFLAGTVLRLLPGRDGGTGVSAAAAAALCALLAAAGLFAFGESEAAARADAAHFFHELRYDERTNSLPEGRLDDLGKWEKSDAPALAVTMDEPQKLYLRGMTGETYTGTAWEPLSGADKAAWAEEFYWLHRDGFNALTGISAVEALTSETAARTMRVENLSACREHAYLPYALCAWDGLDGALIGDAEAPGAETEELSYIPGSVPEWFTAQSALAVRQSGADEQALLALEEIYRSYASENYLTLPEETAAAISRELELPSEQRTLSQIKDIILKTLEERIGYSESTVSYTGGTDFLTYVFERSGSGYSVHYATAAALMLRYFGVPARYVEGYFLSAADAAGYAAGETVVLTEENAHAWAEYYLDGIGWIPFETTPGYMDDEELNAGPGTGLEGERFYRQSEAQLPEDDETEEAAPTDGQTRHFRIPSIVTAVILPLLLVLALALIMALRRGKLRRALRAIEAADNRSAIAALYGYGEALLRASPVKRETLPGAAEAEKLNREALFSAHEMTDGQRETMKRYLDGVLCACHREWSLWQKILYRWIECLYL